MKILAYDDNPDFGGHQRMALRGLGALASDPAIEITCMVNPGNKKLREALGAFKVIEALPGEIATQTPDLVLCLQGDIAQSTAGVAAARAAGVECVSYLALPHSLAEMGAKLGALRDRANRKWLNAPDRFIVISETMKQKLIDRGCAKPISVVPNGIPAPATTPRPASSIRTIGLAGRIEFSQKRQDFMVRAFRSHPVFRGCRLLIVGDGPDEGKLRKMTGGAAGIELQRWTDDIEALYTQIDLLAIPSRYEGVPLVMLEALVRGIPVIASHRDGMKDTLPENWTFAPNDAADLAKTFAHVQASWRDEITTLQQNARTENALEAFHARFANATLGAG